MNQLLDKISEISKSLHSGLKIQQSSANIMTFIVQDLLDYAQIKAGKFRKNITSFNIKDSIEKVMCIQRRKAEEKNLDFRIEYINFRDS